MRRKTWNTQYTPGSARRDPVLKTKHRWRCRLISERNISKPSMAKLSIFSKMNFSQEKIWNAQAFKNSCRIWAGADSRKHAEQGGWPIGVVPAGYRRRGKHDNVLVIDPREAEIVRGVYEMYAAGSEVHRIARKYGKSPQWIYHTLKNKIYTAIP